ncbi:MAG TPA: response regulator [Blastocatellia bacterium]|nr:response regulator [Blastocatellia bacterium]
MSRILLVDDDPLMHQLIESALAGQGHTMRHASGGEEGLAMLEREPFDLVLLDFVMPGMTGVEFMSRVRRTHHTVKCMMITAFGTPEAVIGALREQVCDFLPKPFTIAELRAAVATALSACSVGDIEVISASPEWIELRIPCTLDAVPPLQRLMKQFKADLPPQTYESIAYAFREMLNNAIEHGGKLDPSRYVTVSCVRLKRAIIYRIKDPGEGFDPKQLPHAAINNPSDNPAQHILVREEKGMRAGGFGILLAGQMVDELVYNQKCNELMFIKYL